MFVEEKLYSDIIKLVPILCVDLSIVCDSKFLLVKRNQSPLKDEWWVPGGRILIGESSHDAAIRKLDEELKISSFDKISVLGIYEDLFEESSLGKHLYHTISVVYEFKIDNIKNIELDKTSKEWGLFDNLPDRLTKNLTIEAKK